MNIDLNLAEFLALIFLQIQILLLNAKANADHVDKITDGTLSKPLIESIKKEIKDSIRNGLEALIKRLGKECPDSVDQRKLDTHKTTLLNTLETLVDRLRKGQFMDVRSGPAHGEGEDEKKIRNIDVVVKRTEKIKNQSAQLKVLQIKDSPILGITKADDELKKKSASAAEKKSEEGKVKDGK